MPKMNLKFPDSEQLYPEKVPALERKKSFQEIYHPWSSSQAQTQASRCSQCGIPFCQSYCPLHNNIPDWLKALSEGETKKAYELSSATNSFPEICGRICPQDRLCEGHCVIEKEFGAVTIGAIEKQITEQAWSQGWIQPRSPRFLQNQSVAIIGAGPAGLAAAQALRQRGYQVHIYDRHDHAGGLLMYGIPSFKLDKKVVLRRVDLLKKEGIEFYQQQEIGKDISFQELYKKYDAILIATGVYKARSSQIQGQQLKGVTKALPFLIAGNRKSMGLGAFPQEGFNFYPKGKRIAVIGGGDTAMDCVRTAIRQEAQSVHCIYRRDQASMPGSPREVLAAQEEGGVFHWLSHPLRYEGGEKVEKIILTKMERQGFKNQTKAPQPVLGSEHELPVDLVIEALGFEPEDLPRLFGLEDLQVTSQGNLLIDPETGMTSLDKVFAAGDIVRGASLVVWAIRDGREVAHQISQYLCAKLEPSLGALCPSIGKKG